MDGENIEAQGDESAEQQEQRQEGGSQGQEPAAVTPRGKHAADSQDDGGEPPFDASAFEAQIAERDTRIAELEAQVAEAARNAEAADELRGQIAELKAQGEDERIEFGLMLAGCRNVKAARAVLADHGGDIDALKAAEPWMFQDAPAKRTGKTGLPSAGAANDSDKQMRHWREVAGLADDE